PTQVFVQSSQRLAEGTRTLLAATGLAAVSACILAVLLTPGDWQELAPVFFLTTLGCAAVLVPAQCWTRPAEESWPRRLLFMGLGLVVGLAALWFDGYDLPLPWSQAGEVDSLRPVDGPETRHSLFGLLYPDNRSLP